ncbi:type II secretion system F family protein [Rhodococcus coprophilus]|uniref:Type ii secretion system integral membrane subunit n=1 Tax=Rhodococcus coprophilus TaxID=38310 RepID=A0A2X4X7N6_9NOCA|nr:type II secretion system F family protein [Rhodococcus coprophilus]MBM7458472.1 tight adherence protein B [Rhodococcus coprophilus]SQI32544.1 type ii secretion system integral membrane subunit [Rhodococcus coprophilus]
MIAAILCLAAALLALPGSSAAQRIRTRQRHRLAALRHQGVLVAAVGVALSLFTGVTPALAAAVVAATTLVRMRRGRRAAQLDAHRRMLLSGLEAVIADLRVGAHPADACDTAARETTGPASDVFRVAAARSRLGGSAADGLRSSATGYGLAGNLARLADAWTVSDRHGLALAELLAAARTDLSARMRIRARTDAGLAGARATATVLAGLPLLGVGLGQLMGAAPVAILLSGGLGGMLLVGGTVLACAGLLWTDRIAERVSA